MEVCAKSATLKKGNNQSSAKKSDDATRHWCMTWFSYPENHREVIESVVCGIDDKFIYQEEKTKDENDHIQGFMSFAKRVRFSQVSEWFKGARMDRLSKLWGKNTQKGIMANIKYCSKEHTRKPGTTPICKGYIPADADYKIKLKSMSWWQELIEINIFNVEPDDRTIWWFYDTKGGIGKTIFQKWAFQNHNDVVILCGKATDMKHAIVNFKDKTDRLPKIVLINIPRCNKEYVSYQGIEEIKDMMFFSGKYEGGMICGKNPHVIVFANDRPNKEKMSEDRWRICNIEKNEQIWRKRNNEALEEWSGRLRSFMKTEGDDYNIIADW